MEEGVFGRALKSQLIQLEIENPRDFGIAIERSMIDLYGGGPGNVG